MTITANGEPTLYGHLEELCVQLGGIKGGSDLLILSNGSTIGRPEIQRALAHLDIVKISIDCATQECFRKINRAVDCTIDQVISGTRQFRQRHEGFLVIEVLLVKGVNDDHEELCKLRDELAVIQPDRVDLGTVDRPPAYAVEAISPDELLRLSGLFGELPVHLPVRAVACSGERDYSFSDMYNLLDKRPLTGEEVEMLFNQKSIQRLEWLVSRRVIIESTFNGKHFYRRPKS